MRGGTGQVPPVEAAVQGVDWDWPWPPRPPEQALRQMNWAAGWELTWWVVVWLKELAWAQSRVTLAYSCWGSLEAR